MPPHPSIHPSSSIIEKASYIFVYTLSKTTGKSKNREKKPSEKQRAGKSQGKYRFDMKLQLIFSLFLALFVHHKSIKCGVCYRPIPQTRATTPLINARKI
jgi:hypothetical protein